MTLEPGRRPVSPVSSGRSSPVPRVLRREAEEGLYKKDKNLRRYAQGIERALSFFETPQQEWADYISFLARLLKAVQSYTGEVDAIPYSPTIATRLAQCMNPTLPSGVHQKALDVYNQIFEILGSSPKLTCHQKDSLSRDLNLYFPGLAALPSFASLTVRPLFISLVESHILTLNPEALRPALKSIILCLLPGLEEETSDDFERILKVLDHLGSAVKLQKETDAAEEEAKDPYFWQCFFLAVITNPPRRHGALAYLNRYLPKFDLPGSKGSKVPTANGAIAMPLEAQAAVTPEPGLMIRCFAAGLTDDQILIQRGFLDLLVSKLPLDSPVIQKSGNRTTKDQTDLELLVSAAVGVVTRRDMSLNRRLWSWFLGPEPTQGSEEVSEIDANQVSSQTAVYFEAYGLEPLTQSILAMVKKDSALPSVRARPFRICLSLMDRWEVGGLVVPKIFIPALQSVERYSHIASKDDVDEVMRSASLFFDGVESGLIWSKFLELLVLTLRTDSSAGDEASQKLKLARFILSRFNVREEEMILHHMPLIIIAVLILVIQYIGQGIESRFYNSEVSIKVLEFAEWLVQHLPDRALRSHTQERTKPTSVRTTKDIFNAISKFYFDPELQGNLDVQNTPLSIDELAHHSTSLAGTLFSSFLSDDRSGDMLETTSKILSTLLQKSQKFEGLNSMNLLANLHKALESINTSPLDSNMPYKSVLAMTTVLIPLQSASPTKPFIDDAHFPDLLQPMVKLLWHYLSPCTPKYHVECVRCLWQLHTLSSSSRIVEASITALMAPDVSGSPKEGSSEAGRRFTIIWTHFINERSQKHVERGSRPVSRSNSSVGVDCTTLNSLGIQAVLTRPLFRILDALDENGSELQLFVKNWLQDLPSLNKVFDIICAHLRSLNTLKRKSTNLQSTPVSQGLQTGTAVVTDIKECLYQLRLIHGILGLSSSRIWRTLNDEKVPPLDTTHANAEVVTLQVFIVQAAMRALAVSPPRKAAGAVYLTSELHRTSMAVLQQVLRGPYAAPLREFELEIPLMSLVRISPPALQSMILHTIVSALKLRSLKPESVTEDQGRKASRDLSSTLRRLSVSQDRSEPTVSSTPPPQLIECLKLGFASPSSRLILDDWVRFLAEVLPMFEDTMYQNLLPLVESFCGQIEEVFAQLRTTYKNSQHTSQVSPDTTIISLLDGLEQILEKAHSRLTDEESRPATAKSPEMQQGFFGSVAGVFSSDSTPQARSSVANSRLTVILCFQDTVRLCFSIWSWNGYSYGEGKPDPGSYASFLYASLRLRNRARRILEHLFAAEGLESLETLAVVWCQSSRTETRAEAVLGLLNVLNGAKPKHTIPAIFNAIYSRTSPGALEFSRTSSLSSELSDTDLVAFLVEYTRSLEDDAMDEIWPDCTTFLKDLLTNPMPHRQILPLLLEWVALLAQKVDNTNFGEQKKMRKELGELFTRLLAATFTTRPQSFLQDLSQMGVQDKDTESAANIRTKRATDVVAILADIVPDFSIILLDNDRIMNVATAISTNLVGPAVRAKSFPSNISSTMLNLTHRLSRVATSSKALKKDITDAFNDARFFSFSETVMKNHWLEILRQWSFTDKERMPELLSRISAPATAGIMFGVGAASARLEADRKTQFNLRRIALLILSSVDDNFVPILPILQDRIVDLLAATPSSSPSSATRAEIFMVLRALVLKTSAISLASLWPVINSELTASISAVVPDDESHDRYNNHSILMACKLLDTLVILDPEDFQLHEWLYITDTIDGRYGPADSAPTALVEAVADTLADTTSYAPLSESHDDDLDKEPILGQSKLEAILNSVKADAKMNGLAGTETDVTTLSREEFTARVLRPFFGELSLWAFDQRYAMRSSEKERMVDGLIADLCGGGIVGGE
ncbi:cellular morphogenesis regulator dopa [Pseudovirgaria hyperparasitica]|uniref:Cellular morphogenesis regulator dopa n=1 Tax=Pseudovirgaria hyperparasitica TaxID=470096 RepID=A0A6A6WIC3_9PEZI|nr:cellular morphogenesis regulator dopa [Pseudovirgaria hyperparasitica]KAF2760891.1 cellular morphogenesis regulator dopa [Pseudovirgaria hyperparasitica]